MKCKRVLAIILSVVMIMSVMPVIPSQYVLGDEVEETEDFPELQEEETVNDTLPVEVEDAEGETESESEETVVETEMTDEAVDASDDFVEIEECEEVSFDAAYIVSGTPVSAIQASILSMSRGEHGNRFMRGGNCNNYQNWTECYWFINGVSQELYGFGIPSQQSDPANPEAKIFMNINENRNWSIVGSSMANYGNYIRPSADALKNCFLQAQPGDIVQMDYTKINGENSIHVMMIYSVSDTGVVFYHWGSNDNGRVYFGCNNAYSQNPLFSTLSGADQIGEITYSNLARYFIGADDGLTIYRPNGVISGTVVSTADEFMTALNAARNSADQQTIVLQDNLTISVADYRNIYPDIAYNTGSGSADINLRIDNVRIVGASDSVRLSIVSGCSYWIYVTVGETASIELGPDINPPLVTSNYAYFASNYGLNNYGYIKNATSTKLTNNISGTINFFRTSGDAITDSSRYIYNYGKINWCQGAVGKNYGTIGQLTVYSRLDNYGSVDRVLSRDSLAQYGYDIGHSDGTYRQYGGSTWISYLDSSKTIIYGGSISHGSYTSEYDYSITLSNLNWNSSTGAKVYTSEQLAALYALRAHTNAHPGDEYSWYSPDGSGNITFSFHSMNSNFNWVDDFFIDVSISNVRGSFDSYSMNIYTDFTVADLPNDGFALNLNGCTATFDSNSSSVNVPDHYDFRNGNMFITNRLSVTSPNTLVLTNVNITVGDDIAGVPFECQNGRIIFDNCTSSDGTPIEVQLNCSSDTVEIVSDAVRSVQYLTSDQQAQGDTDYIIRNCSSGNGLASIEGVTDDGQSSLVVIPDIVRAMETATDGTITLISDAAVSNITLNPNSNLVISDGVTLNVDGTVVINGHVSGNGTINVGADGNLVRNNTIDESVIVIESDLIESSVNMYRLYNPNSGEHFYTSNVAERDTLIGLGWNDEGIGWIAPVTSNTPVYRLYNRNGGEHHYTMSAGERDALVAAGWEDEGIGWYSDDAQTVPLYRQYNPNAFANNHNYTTSIRENDDLVALGWRAEAIGWYGVG